jgi:hypothetical protein
MSPGSPIASTCAVLIVLAAGALPPVAGPSTARAAWLPNGTPLVQLPASQESPAIASDGNGGAIVAWRDSRTGSTSDIYAQRVNASGQIAWTVNGVPVCTASGTQSSPDIFPDGAFGAVIAWRDDRNGTGDIYAQRIDAQGHAQWLGNGIPLAASTGNELFPTIISDLSPGVVTLPGFILSYFDRPLGQPALLKVQHVDTSGAGLWAAAGSGGVVVTASTGQKFNSSITTDGVGPVSSAKGAVLVWDEMDNILTWQDIYASRVSATGALLWGAEGTIICGLASHQTNPVVANVGSGNVVVVWEDTRNTGTDLYAQKLNPSAAALWLDQGLPVVTETGSDLTPRILADGVGGAFVFWLRGARVYGQRLNANGQVQWTAEGVPISSIDGAATLGDVVTDGAGGAIVAWIDSRNGTNDLFVQRIDATGARIWDAAGVPLCVEAGEQAFPGLVPDGDNGAIAAWRDDRSGEFDVYANRAFGNSVVSAPVVPSAAGDGPRFTLTSANPTRESVRLLVSLPRADSVSLEVLDVAGRRVRVIPTVGTLVSGAHSFAWDGRDAAGAPVASGTYFVRMTTAAAEQTARVVVVR